MAQIKSAHEVNERNEKENKEGRGDRVGWPVGLGRSLGSAHVFFSKQKLEIHFEASNKIEKNANEVSLDSL